MLKITAFAFAAILGVTTSPGMQGQQDASTLQNRVAQLETWKASADARIQALEKVIKASGKSAGELSANSAERVLAVEVTNKEFDPTRMGSDPSSWKLEDNIWWDATYTATALQKEARSIKGILKFCDLFGDPKFQVRITLDEPIAPDGKLEVKRVGIQYNQFDASHKWLRTTEMENITVRFQVETILYKDRTLEKFGS